VEEFEMIIFWLLAIIINPIIASRYNRNVLIWFVFGVVLGLFSTVILLALGRGVPQELTAYLQHGSPVDAPSSTFCVYCSAANTRHAKFCWNCGSPQGK
jgi:hypothetical protein